jgi:type II secretory pathway pseudopilin PulG
MRAADDRGESLIEILVATAIMGVALVAVLGSVGVGILMSDVHRKQATAGASVRAYAEQMQAWVATGGYQTCGSDTGYDVWDEYTAWGGYTAPTGYTRSVVPGSVRYWDGTTWTTCDTAHPDQGLQQLTLQVASTDDRASERLVVTLRKRCGLEDHDLCS